MMKLLPSAVALSLLSSVSPICAQESDPLGVEGAVAVVYEAPAACPKRSVLDGRLRRGFPDLQLSSDPYAPLFILRISEESGQYRGEFHPPETNDASRARTIDAPNCQDVFDSLHLFVAQHLSAQSRQDYPPHRTFSSGPESSTDGEKATNTRAEARTDEPAEADVPDTSGSLARRPSWVKPYHFHHKTQSPAGELRLDKLFAADLQGGAMYGLLPGSALPRIDLTVRSARFLTPPGERPFLLGFTPRIRATAHVDTTRRTSERETDISGYTFAVGACYSPFYDPSGWVLLGCADAGGGILQTGQLVFADRGGYSAKVGVLRLGASAEAEYNLSTLFHLAWRVGYEANLPLNLQHQWEDGTEVFQPGKDSIYGTMGVGMHF